MKFSFNKSPTKSKTLGVFQTGLQPQNDKCSDQKIAVEEEKKKTDDNNKEKERKLANTVQSVIEDPCTAFQQHYETAIASAEKGAFPDSLRAFDLAIRFWGIYMEQLQQQFPTEYKKLNFPDINACDASVYFLNLYKKNKETRNKSIKKKLWKPPPKHQPQQQEQPDSHQPTPPKTDASNEFATDRNTKPEKQHIEDNDEEIIYFDDVDSDEDDVDCIQDDPNKQRLREIAKWKESVLQHRKNGSAMFEYHAQVLMEMDRDFEAIKACQSAILLNDSDAINWLTLSRAELNFGDPFQALQSISRAIELDFENDEIIEQYSMIYGICNNLTKMKESGKITDDVLKRRLIDRSQVVNQCECQQHVKQMKQRLEHRGDSKDHVGRIDKKTETQQAVDNYQKMLKMADTLTIDDHHDNDKK